MRRSPSNLGRAALGLASKGFHVHPLRELDKRPLLPKWQDQASNVRSVVASWWEEHPAANIGVAVGRSRHFVIDVDVKRGAGGPATMKWLSRELGRLPRTLTARTPSGGWHLYFVQPFLVGNGSNRWPGEVADEERPPGWPSMQGVDLRGGHPGGGHGYVVAPPSVLPEGPYEWRVKAPPAELDPVKDAGWMALLYRPDPPPRVAPPPLALGERGPSSKRIDAYISAVVKQQLGKIAEVGQGARTDTIRDVVFKLSCYPQISPEWLEHRVLMEAQAIGYDKSYPREWTKSIARMVAGAYSKQRDMVDVDRVLAEKDRRASR